MAAVILVQAVAGGVARVAWLLGSVLLELKDLLNECDQHVLDRWVLKATKMQQGLPCAPEAVRRVAFLGLQERVQWRLRSFRCAATELQETP